MANQKSRLRSIGCHSRFAMKMKGVAFSPVSFRSFLRQPYRDMQTKHFCFDSHRALKTGLKKENKSLIQRVVMAIGHILRRGLVGLLWLLWCVFLKCFYKLHQFKQRFHVDPQGNLNKTVSIIP